MKFLWFFLFKERTERTSFHEKITKRFQSIRNAEIDRLSTDEELQIDFKDEGEE